MERANTILWQYQQRAEPVEPPLEILPGPPAPDDFSFSGSVPAGPRPRPHGGSTFVYHWPDHGMDGWQVPASEPRYGRRLAVHSESFTEPLTQPLPELSWWQQPSLPLPRQRLSWPVEFSWGQEILEILPGPPTNIDTAKKRRAAVMTRRLPWMRRFLPAPDGTVEDADRWQMAFVYRTGAVVGVGILGAPRATAAAVYVPGGQQAHTHLPGAQVAAAFVPGAQAVDMGDNP